MSYLKKIEYEIILKDSFGVARNCPKCGRKTHYITTKKFRINANGNKLDVWLIYQCAECKHTLNLDIYRRQKVSSISKEEYQCFLDNKEQLAEMYGKNIRLFQRNKAEIDYEKLYYDYVKLPECLSWIFLQRDCIRIYQKLHTDFLSLSRNRHTPKRNCHHGKYGRGDHKFCCKNLIRMIFAGKNTRCCPCRHPRQDHADSRHKRGYRKQTAYHIHQSRHHRQTQQAVCNHFPVKQKAYVRLRKYHPDYHHRQRSITSSDRLNHIPRHIRYRNLQTHCPNPQKTRQNARMCNHLLHSSFPVCTPGIDGKPRRPHHNAHGNQKHIRHCKSRFSEHSLRDRISQKACVGTNHPVPQTHLVGNLLFGIKDFPCERTENLNPDTDYQNKKKLRQKRLAVALHQKGVENITGQDDINHQIGNIFLPLP